MPDNNELSTNLAPERVGYATVPPQIAKTIYYFETALATGTLFPVLNMPKGDYGPNENFNQRGTR